MNLPLFYTQSLTSDSVVLHEDAARHLQVLRKQPGESIWLTDGKGKKAVAEVMQMQKKSVTVKIKSIAEAARRTSKKVIAISLIKNTSRFEWFLEKATELGIHEIKPMICERTEKEKFRFDRLQNILISAMLQSMQSWLPVLHEPAPFRTVMSQTDTEQHFIAHCMEEEKPQLSDIIRPGSCTLLIGPEGDFTKEEVTYALAHHYAPVALGTTRLRTETAGVAGAVLLTQSGTSLPIL